MIIWHSALNDNDGIAVKSPASGYILPVTEHPDRLYNASALPAALCIEVKQGTVVAPFNGECHFSLHNNRRITFKHQSALTLVLELSSELCQHRGTRTMVQHGSSVRTGQPVLSAELPAGHSTACYAVAMLLPHPAVTDIFASRRFVTAGADTMIILQLKNKTL